MALKSTYTAEEKGAEIEQTLDALDSLCDRLKVLYEQYFMGIQRQPPSHLHTTFDRELRELQQQQIRNTALRYRLASLQQKHGAYNTYWKRTLREIEGGRYHRNLSKLRARAAKTGEEIPEEILARMPKRMRDAIARDREQALSRAERDGQLPPEARAALAADASTEERKRLRRDSSPVLVVNAPPLPDAEGASGPVPGQTTSPLAAVLRSRNQRHLLDDMFGDEDIDQALATLADEAVVKIDRHRPTIPPPLGRPAGASTAVRPIATPPTPTPTPTPTPGMPPAIRLVPPGATPPAAAGPADAAPAAVRAAAPPAAAAPAAAAPPPARAARPSPSPSPSPRPEPPRGIPGMSEADTRALYAKYVKARSLVGDATEPMSYERMVKTLSSQAPKILRDHHSTSVEFNVVVRDNKVILKAKPR